MRRTLAVAACLVTFGCGAGAPDLSSAAEAKALADSAMQLIVSDKVNEAFDLLKTQWPLPSNEIDAIVLKTIQQRNVVEPRFGKTIGYVFIKEEKVSDLFVRYTFAEKHELHAIRWQFTFYKPKAVWKVNAVYWDDNMAELFKQ
jgi:hypothetical protein